KDIISNRITTVLQFVRYDLIGDDVEKCILVCEDKFELNEVTSDRFSFFINRHVRFDPASTFDIEIRFMTERYIKDEYIGHVEAELEKYEIKNEFMKDTSFYTNYEDSWVSMIIAQLTGSFGNSPLITPPMFCFEEESVD
ncbi:MAG: hypothetical protein JJE49_07955, partial [Peptostreptococcaceae bacterium]|nr:hypothetical protein [Peptostreptococcaceae bacterium]